MTEKKRSGRVIGIISVAFCALLVLLDLIFRGEIVYAFSEFVNYLSYPFVRRAMLVGLSVSMCAALLGVSLVLKRYSMIGDGLSHVGFGALAIAMALGYVGAGSPYYNIAQAISGQPILFTMAVVMIAAFGLLRLNSASRIKGDAAIAILSTGALALGVIVVSTTDGMNIDITNYMFGSILSVSDSDVVYSLALCGGVMLLFAAFYHRIFAVTFDEGFAKATGVRAGAYNMLLAALTAVTIVTGMRLMGTMLISSLIIFPALTAMRVFSRFRLVVLCAAAVSIVCFMVGLMLSCVYSLPTGAAVVAANIVMFAIFHIISVVRGIR